jgi:hypothetical protein
MTDKVTIPALLQMKRLAVPACSDNPIKTGLFSDSASRNAARELQGKPPVVALSLGSLRRRIEAALMPEDVDVKLVAFLWAPAARGRRRHSRAARRT